ncbi:P-loop containing nucleoside triphosphate hydrolase protein [Xylariales sp. AK1849]|nr:P-loop containing nucleoside triphosphate hydrolase protein [Xylariales sp. AK1849]
MVQPGFPMASAGLQGSSLRRIFEQTAPGFGTLQTFFARWLNLDITTLAVALTVFGAISTGTKQLRGVALELYRWIVRFFTASVSLPGNDRLNREVLNWVGAKVLMQQKTRILTARSEPVQNDAWDFRRAALKRIDYHHEKRLPIEYLPTFGTTWFFHDHNIFLVRRIPDGRIPVRRLTSTSPDQYVVPPAGNEPLVVMCLGRSVNPIKRFLINCRDFADKQRESFITVRASRSQYHHESWDTTILRPIRPLDTVHMDKQTKGELVSDIDNYLEPSTRRFYTARGIPYRRGYLLHGPPGTGKTSLSLALAGKFGLELYVLHIPSLKDDGELERLFTSLPPQCIVLLEDIDAVGLKRSQEDEDEEEKNEKKFMKSLRVAGKCTLPGLLNVLDGVTSQEGRIVFMTSNIADKLDEALVRPGRIDKMIFMGNICGEAAEEMFLRMYAPDPNDVSNQAEIRADVGGDELKRLAAVFRTKIPDDVFTPAQLQGYLLNHRNQPDVAVAGLDKWTESEKARMEEAEERERELEQRRLKKIRDKMAKQLSQLIATDDGQGLPSGSGLPGGMPGAQSGDPTTASRMISDLDTTGSLTPDSSLRQQARSHLANRPSRSELMDANGAEVKTKDENDAPEEKP